MSVASGTNNILKPIYLLLVITLVQVVWIVIVSHGILDNWDNLDITHATTPDVQNEFPTKSYGYTNKIGKKLLSKGDDEIYTDDGDNNNIDREIVSLQAKVNPTHDSKSSPNNFNAPKPSFHRYKNVVIVTKIHWSKDVHNVKRMLCLLNAAYNQYVNYDILVFTTIPWNTEEIQDLQSSAPNSKLQVVIDGPSPTGDVNDYLFNMTKDEIKTLKERCGAGSDADKQLGWFNHCTEEGMNIVSNLAYNWQSEFRAYHIFKHSALKPYKYMIWMDSDALCTQSWIVDPIQLMVEQNLTILFANFPAGKTEHSTLRTKIEAAYKKNVCHAILNKEGYLWGKKCRDEAEIPHFQHIHGFHHVTNLDVYRKEEHLNFLRSITVGNYRFSRLWDDQLAVTVPAVMDTDGKAWDYWKHNITTNIFHHGDLDGKGNGKNKRSYKIWWKGGGSKKWNAGYQMCDNLVISKKVKS